MTGAAVLCLLLIGCASDPFTGKKSVALVSNSELFPQSFAQYQEFLDQSLVVSEGADAEMVRRVGERIQEAAEKWVASLGQQEYLADYEWEYHLVQSDEINAWCMPGGKIVVYTGILPIMRNEDALAVVLGHEVSHALLNHGQQNQTASILQQVGAAGVAVLTSGMSETVRQGAQTVYGAGTNVAAILPFSRENELEADQYGLYLTAIAGYDPHAAIPFWQRMASLGGGTMEFLSTHPSDEKRITALETYIPQAEALAAELN
jgi:predicted Zn-dependent protease